MTGLRPSRVTGPNGQEILVRFRVTTRVFGVLRETLEVPFTGSGSDARVRSRRHADVPRVAARRAAEARGVTCTRGRHLRPRRNAARPQGPDEPRRSPAWPPESSATSVRSPPASRAMYAAQGYPAGAMVGLDGLERIFQTQLAGSPGGELLAGTARCSRVVASLPGTTCTTTIDPPIEQAAIDAIGTRFAGIWPWIPGPGRCSESAGVGFSALQPPGSTMKIITSTAALQAGS